MSSAAAAGGQLAITALFGSSALSKGSSLWVGATKWHPVFVATPILRRHAVPLMSLSLALDVLTGVLIWAHPGIGAVMAVVLLIGYTSFGVRAAGKSGSCRCFWRYFDTQSRTALTFRNATIGGVALLAGQAATPRVDAWAIGIGAVILCVLASAIRVMNDVLGSGQEVFRDDGRYEAEFGASAVVPAEGRSG